MARPAATDLMKPWTIKSVPVVVIEEVTTEAGKQGLTVGQFLERVWTDWKANGRDPRVNLIADLSALLHAASALPEPERMPRAVRSLITDYARLARHAIQFAPGRPNGVTVEKIAVIPSNPNGQPT